MDKDSFGQLYLELLPGLYRLALGILRHPADAEDAVQQAMANAWQASGRMEAGREKAYIARIVINECHNIQRFRMRSIPAAEIPGREAPSLPDSPLRGALDRLPEKYRLPLLLRYMEGYSEKETAEALRISLNALKSRLRRARSRLEKALDEEEEEEP